MDDHKDNQTDSRRREESVLEQRYKELYGNADTPPEAAVDADASDVLNTENSPSVSEDVAEAAVLSDASPEEASPEAPAETVAPSEDTPPQASQEEADKAIPVEPAPEKRVSKRNDVPTRPPRTAAAWEEDMPVSKGPRKEPPSRGSAPKEKTEPLKTKQPAPRKPVEELADKRSSPGRRVDTLERSQVRRGYGQPPKQPMKLWPWLLVGSILVLALVGLLIYSMLRPLPGQNPDPQGTPAPTGIPASIIGQATVAPTTDLSAFLPTPDPTVEPTGVPSTATPDTSTILRPGTSGDSVRQMQRRLIELGYMASGSDDGDYGNTTQNAVVAFQKAHSLTADGHAGPQTLAILYSEEAKPAAAAEE